MSFSLLILSLVLGPAVLFELKNQIDTYRIVQHNISSISELRTSINNISRDLPAYYIENLILDNCQLIQDVNDTTSRLSVEHERLMHWAPSCASVPTGSSRLAWMHGECNWSYFKSCPNILSEIEYTTNQLSKYSQGNDIDKEVRLLYRLEELQKLRDTNIEKTNVAREEIEKLSERYLVKVNLLSDLRSQLDYLDLDHLIDTDPNIAASLNELYSLMSVRIHDNWTRDYYQGDYSWFNEMAQGEILIDKAVTMYRDLEKRCKETQGVPLSTSKS